MQSSSSSSKQGQEKVRIRLFTTYAKYRVTDAPLAVPSKLGRYGLSEVVNHLLGSEDEPQPFDFIVNGYLIRGSLKKFIAEQRISTEDVVAVEYIPSVSLSGESESVEVPAWVGCLDSRVDGVTVAGCYDGKVQLISSPTLQVSAAMAAHEEPIRSVTTWRMHPQRSVANQGAAFLATASKDNTLKVWSIQNPHQSSPSLVNLAVLKGHINSVECVDFWETSGNDNQRVLLSGDWSGNIFGWNVATLMDDEAAGRHRSDSVDSTGRKAKKQKGSKGTAVENEETAASREVKPAFTIRAHAQAVSGLQARGTGSTSRMFSCSWDHSLKEWDLERQDCLASFAGSKVITSLDYSSASGLLVTSHPDGRVRLWDPRKKDEVGMTGDLVGNGQAQVGTFFSGKETHWVSRAKFHPTNVQVFASCDYDGAVRVWDTRAAHVPLGSTAAHEGKALCVEWLGGSGEKGSDEGTKVLSGGSDCIVRAITLQ